MVSQAEDERILALVPCEEFRDLLRVTLETGCRLQESLRVERRHVEFEHQRWVFPSSEAKGKSAPRIVYLTDNAMEITRRLMLQHPTGALFRNSLGNPLTPESVNSAVDRIRLRMGKAEMERRGETIADEEIDRVTKTLNPFGRVKGKKVKRPQ